MSEPEAKKVCAEGPLALEGQRAPLNTQRLREVLTRELALEASPLTQLLSSFYEDLRHDQALVIVETPSADELEDEGVRALFVLMVWRFLDKGSDYKIYKSARSSICEDLSEHQTAELSADEWVTNFPHHIHIDVESDDHLDALRVGCETFFGSDNGMLRRLYKKLVAKDWDLFLL